MCLSDIYHICPTIYALIRSSTRQLIKSPVLFIEWLFHLFRLELEVGKWGKYKEDNQQRDNIRFRRLQHREKEQKKSNRKMAAVPCLFILTCIFLSLLNTVSGPLPTRRVGSLEFAAAAAAAAAATRHFLNAPPLMERLA